VSAPDAIDESLPRDFNSDRLVSEAVTCALLNISRWTLRRMNERGEGPTRRKISPRRFAYRLRDIGQHIGADTQTPAA
jgi:predicted DNA-binding transcriptional regulator AlpA